MSTYQEESPDAKLKALCKHFLDTCDFSIYDEIGPAMVSVLRDTHPVSYECFEANALYLHLLSTQVFVNTIIYKKPFAHLKSREELMEELTLTKEHFTTTSILSSGWRIVGLAATLLATIKLPEDEKARLHLLMGEMQKKIGLRMIDILQEESKGLEIPKFQVSPVRTVGSA
jgi:hypothetical protein